MSLVQGDVPPVDHFWPLWLVDSAVVGGTVLGLIALVVAIAAIRKSSRDLLQERRIVHELEILREMRAIPQQSKTGMQNALESMEYYLLVLPGSTDFPLARAAIGVRCIPECLDAFIKQVPDAPEPLDTPRRAERLGALIYQGIFAKELNDAIVRRIDP